MLLTKKATLLQKLLKFPFFHTFKTIVSIKLKAVLKIQNFPAF